MKFRASNTCYLSCRIWLQNCFPTANVVSVQLEGERGNGALTLLGVLNGLEEGVQRGATSQMRAQSRSATKASHVKATILYDFFAAGIN